MSEAECKRVTSAEMLVGPKMCQFVETFSSPPWILTLEAEFVGASLPSKVPPPAPAPPAGGFRPPGNRTSWAGPPTRIPSPFKDICRPKLSFHSMCLALWGANLMLLCGHGGHRGGLTGRQIGLLGVQATLSSCPMHVYLSEVTKRDWWKLLPSEATEALLTWHT